MPAAALKGKKKAVMAPEEELQEEEMREGSEEEEPMATKDTEKQAKKKDGEGCNCKTKKGRKKMDSLTAGMFRNDARSKKCGGGWISFNKECRQGRKKAQEKAEKAYAKKPKSFARKAAGAYLKASGVLGTAGSLINAGVSAASGNLVSAAGHLGAAKAYHSSYKAAKRGKLGGSFRRAVAGNALTYGAVGHQMFSQLRKKRDGATYAKGFNVDYSRLKA